MIVYYCYINAVTGFNLDKTAGFASRVQRYGGAFPFGFPLDGQHWLLCRLRGRRGPVLAKVGRPDAMPTRRGRVIPISEQAVQRLHGAVWKGMQPVALMQVFEFF